jgi:hypothetical protein
VDNITLTSGGTQIPQRMWIATDGTFGAQAGCTAGLYFWPIPYGDETPFADTNFSPNYCPQGYLEQSITDSETPGTWKTWRKIETWTEGQGAFGASTNVIIGAVLDNTMSASFDSTVYSQKPKDWHYFKNTNNDAIGLQAQLSLQLNTAATGSTPIVHTVVGHNLFRPRIAEIITAKARIADGIEDRQGGQMRDGASMLNELETFSKSSNPYPLIDLAGRTLPIVVMPGVDEEETYQDVDDYPEIVATVKLGIIDASWNAAPAIPFHPDGG